MTSKTFKSVTDNESELDVRANDCGVFIAFSRAGQIWQASTFAPSDATALALAILEAAGVEPSSAHYGLNDSPEWNVRWASHYLGRSIELTEAKTAEAKEQAELEAEALELLNAYRAVSGGDPLGTWRQAGGAQEYWLAVARKAREMRAEK